MKLITSEQKELIIKLKSFCDNKDFGNPLDNVNLDAFTIGDASTLIKGLLGLQKCSHLALRGFNSYAFQRAMDDLFCIIEKYQNK